MFNEFYVFCLGFVLVRCFATRLIIYL